MSEVHFSLVICGTSNTYWVVYAFDKTRFEDDGEESLSDRIFCGGSSIDPIASCLSADDVDANLLIWDLREYFLNVVSSRLCHAADSWEALLRAIERRIKDHVS